MVPITQEVIDRVNQLGRKENQPKGIEVLDGDEVRLKFPDPKHGNWCPEIRRGAPQRPPIDCERTVGQYCVVAILASVRISLALS